MKDIVRDIVTIWIYFAYIFILFCFFTFTFCARSTNPHLITEIPGYKGEIDYNQWSGYVTANEKFGRNLYYIFVESHNPSDRVILWLQGGPGCSGIMAYMTENGPYTLNTDGTVMKNEYSLVGLGAHVIYVDSPAGIGYGYVENFHDFLSGGDNRTTNDLYIFLQEFFTNLFPQYRKNELYIFGESYGGIYISWLSIRIDEENEKGIEEKINLKGIMMSNAIMKFKNYYDHQPMWLMTHAVLSPEQYSIALKDCDGEFYENMNVGKCAEAWKMMNGQQLGLNVLDLYTECYNGIHSSPKNDPMVDCIDTETSQSYFNMPESYKAFGVADGFFNYTKYWLMCSSIVQYQDNYTTVLDNVIPLIQVLYKKGYEIMIASGDVDMSVTTFTNFIDFAEIIYPDSISEWKQWYTCQPKNKQIAGWYRSTESLEINTALYLASIKGSGHMISEYKPMQSWLLYKSFLEGNFPGKQC